MPTSHSHIVEKYEIQCLQSTNFIKIKPFKNKLIYFQSTFIFACQVRLNKNAIKK